MGGFLSEAHHDGRLLPGVHHNGRLLPGAHQDGRILPGAHHNGRLLSGAHQDGRFLPGAHHDGKILPGAHHDGRLLSGAHQDGRFLSGACQEPARTIRTIRKIKILSGPPGALQEPSRRPPGSWHPNKILMWVTIFSNIYPIFIEKVLKILNNINITKCLGVSSLSYKILFEIFLQL